MKTKPSPLQKRAVDNVLSGNFKSVASAMREAGYSETTSHRPSEKLAGSKGVQAYLKQLGGKAIQKFGMSLEDKVLEVYLEGLDAQKPHGKNAKLSPDHMTRLQFADRFTSFFGWSNNQTRDGKVQQQFNFFNTISEEEGNAFNKQFNDFLNKYYADRNSK